jgi:hypothetical protein
MALHLTMYAMAHGVEGARLEDYLPPWQQPQPEPITDEKIIAAAELFRKASAKCQIG